MRLTLSLDPEFFQLVTFVTQRIFEHFLLDPSI